MTQQGSAGMTRHKDFSPLLVIGRLIRFSGGLYALNVVLWVGVYTMPLLPGYVSKLFFDVLEHGSVRWAGLDLTLRGIIVLVLLQACVQITLIFSAIRANIPWRFRSSSLLRLNLLQRIFEMPGAKAVPGTVGEALNTLRDDAGEAEDASDWTLDVIGQTVYMVLALLILLGIDAQLTLWVFLPLVFVTALSYRFRRELEALQQTARETSSHYTALLGETFLSVQAIQVAGAETQVLAQLEQRSKARSRAMLRNVALNQALGVFTSNIVAIGTGLILLLAGGKMRSGEFTVGEFSLFVLYLWEVGHHTEFFGNFIATLRRAGVAFTRMLGLMQGAPLLSLTQAQQIAPDNETPLPPKLDERLEHLRVERLRFVHPESGRGLFEANFAVRRGEFVVVTGRIGSGKTTLLRALLGLLTAQEFEVYWNDTRITQAANLQPPRSAYTPQVPALISGSVHENIALGNANEITNAIHAAVLEQDLAQLPNGLETLVGVRGLKLSGGQLQRTAAARMFAQGAELLVFDDISSALDVNTERELWARLAPGTTCLVVSHRRAALERADKIVLLEHGRASVGTLRELLPQSSEMRAIWAEEKRFKDQG